MERNCVIHEIFVVNFNIMKKSKKFSLLNDSSFDVSLKIALTGSGGFIGKSIQKGVGARNIPMVKLNRTEIDIYDFNSLHEFLKGDA